MGLRSRVSLPLLVISLWLSSAPLSAEPTDQPKPPKPLKLMETPRGFLEAASFGDMLGLPDWMAMSLSLVSQPMGNVTGSFKRTFSSIDMQAIDLGLGSGLMQAMPKSKQLPKTFLAADHATTAAHLQRSSKNTNTIFTKSTPSSSAQLWSRSTVCTVETHGATVELKLRSCVNRLFQDESTSHTLLGRRRRLALRPAFQRIR